MEPESILETESYSQFGQDIYVLELSKKNNGFFVDVGFYDGKYMSNTYLLEKKGWKGIGIDAYPKNTSIRPNTIIEQCCLSDKQDDEVDFVLAGTLSGIYKNLGRHKETNRVKNAEIIKIKTSTLEKILTKNKCPNFIDYMSVDIEGSEYDVLKNFPFNTVFFVKYILVEHNQEIEKKNKIENLLFKNGYNKDNNFKKSNIEDFYILNEKNYKQLRLDSQP